MNMAVSAMGMCMRMAIRVSVNVVVGMGAHESSFYDMEKARRPVLA